MRSNSLALGVKLNRLAEQRLLEEMENLEVDLKKFWSRVQRGNNEDCWLWTGSLGGAGYGQFLLFKRTLLAHRVSYILHSKKIIEFGMYACHKCDKPSCVNPNHIFLGTQKDNMSDCSKKNRTNKSYLTIYFAGENGPNSKLTNQNVIKIRELLNKGCKQIEISSLFNISQPNVSDIKRRNTYKNI